MKVKINLSIAECSPSSILQYFSPALSDTWSSKPNCGLFESGSFTQVLLFLEKYKEDVNLMFGCMIEVITYIPCYKWIENADDTCTCPDFVILEDVRETLYFIKTHEMMVALVESIHAILMLR